MVGVEVELSAGFRSGERGKGIIFPSNFVFWGTDSLQVVVGWTEVKDVGKADGTGG